MQTDKVKKFLNISLFQNSRMREKQAKARTHTHTHTHAHTHAQTRAAARREVERGREIMATFSRGIRASRQNKHHRYIMGILRTIFREVY